MESQQPRPRAQLGYVLSLIVMAMIGGSSLLSIFLSDDANQIARPIAYHLIVAVLATSMWATLFRSQLQQWRFSLLSLFVLIMMQAAGLWLVQAVMAAHAAFVRGYS